RVRASFSAAAHKSSFGGSETSPARCREASKAMVWSGPGEADATQAADLASSLPLTMQSRILSKDLSNFGRHKFSLKNRNGILFFKRMVQRLLAQVIAERMKLFPALALVGPRQCGKTTLARGLGSVYFNLEDPNERTRLDASWSEATAAKT